jgi:hypothetical protein
MDLGFGSKNHEVGSATANVLLQGAKAQEEALEVEMAQFDKLLDDEDGLEVIRQKRLAQMQNRHFENKKWKDLGHGTYTELGGGQDARDVAKEFFQATKESDRIVVHFYRPTTRFCDVFHAHLSKLAPKHLETRFLMVNVEGCDHQGAGASFLVEKLGVCVMPSLVLIKDRRAFHHMTGFDEVGGSEDFSEQALAYVLGCHGVVDPRDDEDASEEVFKKKGVNAIRIQKGARNGYYRDADDEFE